MRRQIMGTHSMTDAPTLTAERLDELFTVLASYDDGCVAFITFDGIMGVQELRALIALARSALNAPGREEADFAAEVARIEPDFPNYASWAIELPAGHWRALIRRAPTPNRDKLREDMARIINPVGWYPIGFLTEHTTAVRNSSLASADAILALLPDRGGGVPSGVYVASRASVLERGAMWRRYRDTGAPIISTWIDEDGPNDTADLDELWVRIRREVITAERLILYVESSDFPLKGAFVEIGLALGANVPIFIVAPDVKIKGRNQRPFGSWIKHPLVRFAATVDEALAVVPTSQEGV